MLEGQVMKVSKTKDWNIQTVFKILMNTNKGRETLQAYP